MRFVKEVAVQVNFLFFRVVKLHHREMELTVVGLEAGSDGQQPKQGLRAEYLLEILHKGMSNPIQLLFLLVLCLVQLNRLIKISQKVQTEISQDETHEEDHEAEKFPKTQIQHRKQGSVALKVKYDAQQQQCTRQDAQNHRVK